MATVEVSCRARLKCNETARNFSTKVEQAGLLSYLLLIRVDQLLRKDFPLDVVRSRKPKVLQVGHQTFLAYLNNFKGSQKAGNLNLVTNARRSFVSIHDQRMQRVLPVHHPPKAPTTTPPRCDGELN